MARMPLIAKLGEKVHVTINQSPPATALHSTTKTLASRRWHLPYWSAEYDFVISPPWVIALAMIAVGMTILVVSACRTLRKRKSMLLGEKGRLTLLPHTPVNVPSCNIV